MTKAKVIYVRVDDPTHASYATAATAAGLTIAEWARQTLDTAANERTPPCPTKTTPNGAGASRHASG